MYNPYQPKIAIIKKIQRQVSEVKLFTLNFKNKRDRLKFIPGQFVELGVPGFGEAPFAPCSNPQDISFQICIRRAGSLTSKLHSLKVNDSVTIRGPFGNGFPNPPIGGEDKNLLLVGGGLGIIPLRSLILSAGQRPASRPAGKTRKIQIFYGARHTRDLLFKKEFRFWQKSANLCLTLDKKCPGWRGHIGLITTLFDDVKLIPNAIAIVCGPPIMYKFVLKKLKEANFSDTDIYLSLERRMHCGIGVCQHCTIGSKYVCKDGPIFRYDELKKIKGAI